MTTHARRATFLIPLFVVASAFAHDGDPKMLDRQPQYPGPGWRNAQRVGRGGGLVDATAGIGFTSSNVTLLAWLSLPDFGITVGGNGNSCYGYTSPAGREYALMGLSTGTAIVEITQPGNPVIVAQIAGPGSLWRDIRVYSHYAYAVSEGGGGIQVIDLGNVDNGVVTLANTITTGGSLATHTVEINTASGYLYRAGGGTGLRIYDLNANPASPNYVGTWADRYVHEAQIVTYPTGGPGGGPRELAICCGGLNNGYTDTGIDIVDVTNHALPVAIRHVGYPSASYSHQACLSPDRSVLFHDDEIDGLPLTRVFDATQLAATGDLTYLGGFSNGVTVDHNIYTKGTLLFESNYRSGLHVFDTASGVLAPTEVAWFDTYPGDNNLGYNGLWNNYPYFASGVVIGSDIEKGLFVWWIGAPQIAFSFANGRPDTIAPAGGPIVVHLDQRTPGVLQPGSAGLWYDAGAGWTRTPLAAIGGDDYSASLPATACGTRIRYYVEATATNGLVWSAPENAPTGLFEIVSAYTENPIASYDFETSAGWTAGASGDSATQGVWTRADPLGTGAQPSDDHSTIGDSCWFTGQGVASGAIGDSDVDGGRTTLVSPNLDLAAANDPIVSYWRWYSNNEGPNPGTDVFRVDVSTNGGTTWTNVETIGPGGAETNGSWILHQFRVSDYVAPSSSVRLRFVAEDTGADSVVEAAIDDVRAFDASCGTTTTFCVGDGSQGVCPCANYGFVGEGCANSSGFGAALNASGTPSLAHDTLVLHASGVPIGAPTLFYQGTSQVNGGLGTAFGDGLRCVSGTVVRLGTHPAVGGSVSYPAAGDVVISVRGSVPSGATRDYQGWYRNSASFCTSATFNLTNGLGVAWVP